MRGDLDPRLARQQCGAGLDIRPACWGFLEGPLEQAESDPLSVNSILESRSMEPRVANPQIASHDPAGPGSASTTSQRVAAERHTPRWR